MVFLTDFSHSIFELLGVAGFLFYMLSYGLLQLGRISGSSFCYTLMNIFAAILVLMSLVNQFNLASVLIQVSWIIISVVGLTRMWQQKRSNRNTTPYNRASELAHT